MSMLRRGKKGFTLLELLISLSLFAVVMVGASAAFGRLMRAHGKQSKLRNSYLTSAAQVNQIIRAMRKGGFTLTGNAAQPPFTFTNCGGVGAGAVCRGVTTIFGGNAANTAASSLGVTFGGVCPSVGGCYMLVDRDGDGDFCDGVLPGTPCPGPDISVGWETTREYSHQQNFALNDFRFICYDGTNQVASCLVAQNRIELVMVALACTAEKCIPFASGYTTMVYSASHVPPSAYLATPAGTPSRPF